MPHVSITLQAGKPKRQTFGVVRYLTITDLGASASVDLNVEVSNFAQESVRNRKIGDRIAVPDGFDSATFIAPVDCVIEVFASLIDLRINNNDGSTVNANIVGTVPVNVTGPNPLPVATTRGGAPGTPFFVTGLTYQDTPAASLLDLPGVAVADVAVQVAPANAVVLERRFTNIGAEAVAIGAAGITWAKRCLVIQPGETWVEVKGAALAWYGITDAGGAGAVVNVQELHA